MTRAHMTLADLGAGLPERTQLAFLRNLPPESATVREADPDSGGWSRAEMLLAQLCDSVANLVWITACKGAPRSKWPPAPDPIERPGVRNKSKRRLGRGAIPIEDFEKWWGGDTNGKR